MLERITIKNVGMSLTFDIRIKKLKAKSRLLARAKRTSSRRGKAEQSPVNKDDKKCLVAKKECTAQIKKLTWKHVFALSQLTK